MQIKHSNLLEESSDIKIIIDKQDFKIIEANKAARKFFKVLKNNKKDKYLTDIFPVDISGRQLKKFANKSSKKSFQINSVELTGNNGKVHKMNAEVVKVNVKTKKFLSVSFTENKNRTTIKNTNDELKNTRLKLKSIFDNNPLMIFILDRNGIIKEVNTLGAKELGYKVNELLNQSVEKVFLEDDWKTVKNQILKCVKNPGKMFNWEIKKVKKNGEIIWVRENASTIESNGKNLDILIVCDNITKIKEAEESVNESTAKVKQIFDASPYGVHVYDLKDNEDLIFTAYNSAADKILGIEHSQFINKKIGDVFPRLHTTEIPKIYSKVASKGIKFENEFIEYDDKYIKGVFDVSAIQIAPGKVAVFFVDITEKRKAFDKLEKSELKFKSLFELANDSIFIMDHEIFIDCNEKTLEIFGCNKEDIIGKPPYDFSPEKQSDGRYSKEIALEKITAALAGIPQRFEWKHKKFNGELFDAEVSLNRIKLGAENLIQAIVRDITERKSAEEQILMLAHALKSIYESVCITDMMDNIIFVNNSFCNIFGYSNEEIIGKHISVLRSERNSANIINQILPETLKGGWSGEIISKRKDGTEFPASVSTSVIRNDEGKPVALITAALNITDRKISENELRNSKQMLQLILDNIPQRIFWKDLDSRYLGCNKNFAKDAGLSKPSDLIGSTDYDMPWKSAEADYYRSIDYEVMKNDKPTYHLIEPQTHLDGQISWLETNKIPLHDELGKVVGVLGTYEDITERKKAEEALKDSEARFRSLIDNMIEAALIIDWDGEIIFANNSAAHLVGLENPGQGIGKKVFDFLHPDFITRVLNVLAKSRKSSQPIIDEYLIKTVDGEDRWVESLGTKITFADKNSILVTMRDITERKNTEYQLKIAKEQAEELSKIKSNFLANMSHELRTPLVGILGFAELLKEELKKEELKEMADRILISGNRLMDTLNSVLDLSRIEANKVDLKIWPHRLAEMVKSQVQLFEAVAERKNLYLKTVIADNTVCSEVDEQIFRQIINNLVNNALKYTLSGGIIVTIDSIYDGSTNYARITVKDTGIGIPEGSLGMIFQEFRQVSEGFNRHFEGSGLGLTITKKFVDIMNGRIGVTSEVGSGSTFTVLFPLVKDYATSDTNTFQGIESLSEASEENEIGRQPKVLIVENDEGSKDITRLFLRNFCELEFADSGEEAIKMVGQTNFDIILMDINLGVGMSGIDATKQIRKINGYKNIPIVALTGFAMRGDREEFIKAGCTHYLSKPFSKQSIIKLVKNIVHEKQD
ncbi:MAG: PAS domain S-box protein [Ignavibacteriaceae bacterium]|nr:PAS domain S-box protein [Ignavibacteriaceae bacterium]